MGESQIDLEKHLIEAGNKLLSPPSSLTQLLSLLNRVEDFLARVEQSPSELMKKALSPLIKALIADGLLRHSDNDVKVSVASCISEITRITAPDAPYEDDQMKEAFQLIVSSFENLDDKSSPSYNKRTSILETLAKVRSCVVMLDLECDALILEMFKHFFRSIRDDHPENVFSSMETIMTLVIEESDDISVDLLSSLLEFLRTTNKEAQPIARQLAEKVIVKCATKLKPYVLQAVKSHGAALDDYSNIVANICQTKPVAVEPHGIDVASKKMTDELDLAIAPPEKAVEVNVETFDDAPLNEEGGPTLVGSPKSIMCDSALQKVEDISAVNVNSKEADPEASDLIETKGEPRKSNSESFVVEKLRLPSKSKNSSKRKGRKTSVLKSSSEPSEPSLAHDEKEVVKVPEHQEKGSKGVDFAKTEDPVADAAGPSDCEKLLDAPDSSPKTLENDCGDSPSSINESLADVIRSKKAMRGKKKDDSVQEPIGDVNSTKEPSAMNTHEGAGVSHTKSHKRSGKKVSSASDNEVKTPCLGALEKEEDSTKKSNSKSTKCLGKKVEVSSERDEKKKGQVKATPRKDIAKTPSKDVEKKTLPESAGKSTKDGSDMEKASKTSSKRKQSSIQVKASETKRSGQELVGSKVKVWWPKDKIFYEGIVGSYDSVTVKHTILYDDGDVEVLYLPRQKWQLIDDESAANKGHSSDGGSPGESSETPIQKKAKLSADAGSKRGKINSADENSKATPKPARNQDSNKKNSSSEDGSSKVGKLIEDKSGKLKSGNKSSDDQLKSIGKAKDNDRAATKSKGKSPKTGSKSNTNGSGKVKSRPSPKDEEEDNAEMSPKTAAKTSELAKGKSKSASKSSKSGKKRKR